MTLSCTKKVLVKLKGIKEIATEVDELHLNNWYVDWVTLYRRRFAIVMNSKTLFTVLMYCGTKNEVKNFESLFVKTLQEQILRQTLLQPKSIAKLDLALNNCTFTKTNSQRVLGHLRDFKCLLDYYQLNIDDMEDELNHLIQRLNDNPIRSFDYKNPREILIETLKN